MIDFNSINSVRAVWTDDGSSYVYEALPDSVRGNEESKSIRFTLREVDGQDDDLEIVIQQKVDGSYTFKTDYYDDPLREYPVKIFAAGEEFISYYRGKEGIVYFHLAG